jgi:hypothetical protein
MTELHSFSVAFAARLLREVSTSQGHELHLYGSTIQRPVLLLELSTPQGSELHLYVSTIQRPKLLEVSTPQGSELHLYVSAIQRPELLLEVTTPQVSELHLYCLHGLVRLWSACAQHRTNFLRFTSFCVEIDFLRNKQAHFASLASQLNIIFTYFDPLLYLIFFL